MIYYIPFLLQGVAFLFDEFYFHYRRNLPLWERIGHPLDTLSVLVCYLWILMHEYNDFNLRVYIGLAVFSSVLVTKDEFVHSQQCEPSENWLHSVLFILHPVTFLSAGIMWIHGVDQSFLIGQSVLVGLFTVYQILYWSPLWKKTTLK